MILQSCRLSIPAVGERIKKLSEKNFIKTHTTILGHKEAGLDLTAYVFIISEHSDHYDKFVEKANECKAVMECHSITGGGSHILKVRVKNSQALEDLLYEMQNWPGVSRTQSNVVLSTYKESTEIDLNILYELV
jgi:Transcriptional regulators